ncbi:MAG: M23 family metallopeptidase [Bdellovibrionota bacterium]
MNNRFYTIMVIPEKSAQVKKWMISHKMVQAALAVGGLVVVFALITTLTSLRYLQKKAQFESALTRNHYLEGQLQLLNNQINIADSTLVRVQNFEQKLRVLADLDTAGVGGGFGPLPQDEGSVFLKSTEESPHGTLVASLSEDMYNNSGTDFSNPLELKVDSIHRKASLQEQSLQELYELLKDQRTVLSSRPSVWPAKGWLTSTFGYRISPFTGLRHMHSGIDIAAAIGTEVRSPANGVVTRVGTEPGFGKFLVINHGYGIVTRYGHNSKMLVKVGQKVKRGEPISLVGNTGRSTGPHLHYEIRVNGVPVNPMQYILD